MQHYPDLCGVIANPCDNWRVQALIPIVARLTKHRETLIKYHETLVKHCETLINYCKPMIKHYKTLVKHHETLTVRCYNISA